MKVYCFSPVGFVTVLVGWCSSSCKSSVALRLPIGVAAIFNTVFSSFT